MRLVSFGFLLGVVGLQWFRVLPGELWVGAVGILAMGLGVWAVRCPWMRFFVSLCLGFVWVWLFAHAVMGWALPKGIEGKTITLTGIVASIPQADAHRVKFEFAFDQINHTRQKAKVMLSWYNDPAHAFAVHVGDRWRLAVRLKRPHGLSNPGGFDLERWLFQHRIRATGYVVSGSSNRRLASRPWVQSLDRLRESLKRRLDVALDGKALSGLIPALTIGLRDGISTEEWTVFRNTGTAHLVAISGLHIGLIAGLFYLLASGCWRLSRRLMHWAPAQQAGAVGALVGALGYSGLAGFSLSTQRAIIMIAVFMGAQLCRRNISPWSSFCLALLIVLIIDPLATLGIGFWLSFCAVAAILYGMGGRLRPQGLWWKWGRAQWVVGLILLPLSLLAFQQGSLVALGANLIAIPWVGFVVVPLALLGSVTLWVSQSLGVWLLSWALWAFQLLWVLLKWFAGLQMASWHHAIYNNWVAASAVIGVLLLAAPRGVPARWLGLLWLCPLIFFNPSSPKVGQVWFSLLDVGQGLSAVVQTAHHVLVYDTGPKFSARLDSGSDVVIPYLRQEGISHIDTLMISHGDNDHIGGAQSILQAIPVGQVLSSVPNKMPIVKARHCYASQHWEWDGVEFRVLYPMHGERAGGVKKSGNDESCVLQVSNGQRSILLTGDIERPSENYLLAHEKVQLPSTILIAPHHGSKTSSTQSFINAVKPSFVLFPIGYRNRFRFPSAPVIARYQAIGARLLDTAQSGAITFYLSQTPTKIVPIQYRNRHRHFWQD